jgi:hypothetical protein
MAADTNKPKNIELFLFTGLHHLAAIQNGGICIWNGLDSTTFTSWPWLLLSLADVPGMAFIHQQKKLCRYW